MFVYQGYANALNLQIIAEMLRNAKKSRALIKLVGMWLRHSSTSSIFHCINAGGDATTVVYCHLL